MSKHTPGPWYQVGYWVEVEDDDVPDICSCHPKYIGQSHLKFDLKTIEANARLIAAAPDLLKALKLAKKIIGHPDDDASKYIASVISKATGKR